MLYDFYLKMLLEAADLSLLGDMLQLPTTLSRRFGFFKELFQSSEYHKHMTRAPRTFYMRHISLGRVVKQISNVHFTC